MFDCLDFHIKHQFLAFAQNQGEGFIKLGVLSHYGNFLLYLSSHFTWPNQCPVSKYIVTPLCRQEMLLVGG